MNLTEAIDWGTDQLCARQIEEPRLEAEIILVHALGIKKSELILHQSLTVKDESFKRYKELIGRRGKREPTAYILGFQPFLGFDIIVNRSVLIPRPETEFLAEQALKVAGRGSRVIIADIGTGSGCLAVALAKKLPLAEVYAIDSSNDALKVAKKNAEQYKVGNRCHFIKGNLLEPLKEPVDLIVANPPYIPSAEIKKLQPEVRDWEPKRALDGGKDGLDHIRKILKESPKYLKPGGRLVLEFGFGQAAEIERLAAGNFEKSEIIKDYAGILRVMSTRAKANGRLG
ncbi:MAG: peptide chain release factor N(5)-glutamine methyltransferase [Candidatus Saganbacteria bacterium]|nr:peptide chain release factor N(5)-glutamine methyltransferase [Candidatus Saganbacteria bacterium]